MPDEYDDAINAALNSFTTQQWEQLRNLAEAVNPEQPGHWSGEDGVDPSLNDTGIVVFPSFVYTPELRELVEYMYDVKFIVAFPWPDWAEAMRDKLDAMSSSEATPADLMKYIVTVVRSDRFAEGYLGQEIVSGRFLGRLRAVIHHYLPTEGDRASS